MAALVFGANTDVGKTLWSVGLIVAHLRRTGTAAYLKPLQTGVSSPSDGDAALVRRYATGGALAACDTLHAWPAPASPHVAAREGLAPPPTDAALRAGVAAWLEDLPTTPRVVETAGGVLSPSAAGAPQADVYAGLAVSAALVGDGRLGGISATLAAWECLCRRGFSVDAVLFAGGDGALGNAAYIEAQTRATVVVAPPPPPMPEPLGGWLADAATSFDAAVDALGPAPARAPGPP